MTAQTRYDLNAVFLLVLLGAATAADAQVQPQLAQRYFDEATKLCERDAGRCGVCRSVVRCNADCGVLRAADGSTLSVPVTVPREGTTLHREGWSATVNSGWVVRPAADLAPLLSFARTKRILSSVLRPAAAGGFSAD